MEQEYTIKVTAKETDLLFEALVELPFKKVADVFFKIRQQVFDAMQPVQPQPQVEGDKA